ncbi:MAG: helix-turn-helix domain-containing protein [Smithellaceae bacterium]|nr:helix-turn-helix domain-containing protein [Smithellaceae bacterium]
MQKGFEQLNYYEMLDIKPDAVPFEIRHAYNAALQVYQPGSLASYSFFSGDERRDILSLIEKAYATLINDQARKDYNEELISRGELNAEKVASPAVKKPVSIFNISHSPAVRIVITNNEALKRKINQSQLIGDILAQNALCGADLKKIRSELGVEIEQIAQETKIRHDHLRSMEEDHIARLPAAVFLKGFVRSYLKCLCLEPVEELSTRYMDTVARFPQK